MNKKKTTVSLNGKFAKSIASWEHDCYYDSGTAECPQINLYANMYLHVRIHVYMLQ